MLSDRNYGADAAFVDVAPISREVAQRLEHEIIRGGLAPGQKLVETELCERYGISRSPLREAFHILESDGLVVRRPRYGVRVAEMSRENIDDIFVCRVPLEAVAAALIAEREDHEDVASRLAEYVDAMDQAYAREDYLGAFEANVALTDVLHAACNNTVLQRLLGSLNKPALRYRYWVYRQAPESIGRIISSNRAMIAAIAVGDSDEAEKITADLVRGAWSDMREAMAARPTP